MRSRWWVGACVSLVIGCVSGVPEAYAQDPINSYIKGYYVRGATNPITTQTVPIAQIQCGQTKVVGGSTVDPTRWVWDDPSDVTKDCIFTDPYLVGTVIGYGPLDGRSVACNGSTPGMQCSTPSNTAQFLRTDTRPPSVPANLRIVR